jgi:potassium-transporting ATPase KdpC subunit
MFKQLWSIIAVFFMLTLITGVIYPLVVTAIAQVAFSRQADGSLIVNGDKIIGSELIGQSFDDPKYFWGRPSATSAFPDDSSSSTGSNLGPTNPDQLKAVSDRMKALRDADPSKKDTIPIDLVTASASGLDPHISPAAAEFQLSRVARVRGLTEDKVRKFIAANTEGRTFGFLGEPRVNVLKLNLDLDGLPKQKQ